MVLRVRAHVIDYALSVEGTNNGETNPEKISKTSDESCTKMSSVR